MPTGLVLLSFPEVTMAYARIVHHWDADMATVIEVGADGQHPDLLDELVSRALTLWRGACPDVAVPEVDTGEA